MRGVWLLGLLLVGCVAEPKDGIPYEAPPIYREWFERVERCSGRSGRFERIEWFAMQGATFMANGDRELRGIWYPGHRIYIAERDTLSRFVVSHEMLHDLLGGGEHSNPAFKACHLEPR